VIKAVKEGDAAFTNFEETTPKPGTWPGATSGNTYMNTTPDSIQDLIDMGINLFGLANNHAFDFGTQGLVDTLEATAKFKSVAAFAGAGHTLGEARGAAYLNARHGRIALIVGNSTIVEAAVAGDPRPDMPGRPSINPVRYTTFYNVDQATFDILKSIQNRPGFAGNFDQGGGTGAVPGIWGAEGFGGRRDPNTVTMNGRVYHLIDKPGIVRKLMQHDMDAIVHNVKDAKARATYVLTSVHNHENGVEPFPNPDPALGNPASTADFMIEFAHGVIDAGADEYSGHGPHNLRGIEIYKGKPILYSLSDFDLIAFLYRVDC
jgi:poly-gamma-glutamate capsule biosynthesis protein CapA/YwtB (metallophosphatase superfamily)